MTALRVVTLDETPIPVLPEFAGVLDLMIGQQSARAHRAKLALEDTGRELAGAQELVRSLQLALGDQQRDHQEAGRELAALVLVREIVGRADASPGRDLDHD